MSVIVHAKNILLLLFFVESLFTMFSRKWKFDWEVRGFCGSWKLSMIGLVIIKQIILDTDLQVREVIASYMTEQVWWQINLDMWIIKYKSQSRRAFGKTWVYYLHASQDFFFTNVEKICDKLLENLRKSWGKTQNLRKNQQIFRKTRKSSRWKI